MPKCDRCGSLRLNGAPVQRMHHNPRPDEWRVPIRIHSARLSKYEAWCRGCIRWARGAQDDDPAEKGETAAG